MATPLTPTITANDVYTFVTTPGHSYTVQLGGTFGGATVTFAASDPNAGDFTLPTYGTATAATTFVFTAPAAMLKVTVAGGTGIALGIAINHVPA